MFMSRTELGIGNGQRNLLLILNLIQQAGKARSNLSFHKRSHFFQSCSSTVEFLEALQFHPTTVLEHCFEVEEKFCSQKPMQELNIDQISDRDKTTVTHKFETPSAVEASVARSSLFSSFLSFALSRA